MTISQGSNDDGRTPAQPPVEGHRYTIKAPEAASIDKQHDWSPFFLPLALYIPKSCQMLISDSIAMMFDHPEI
ncbi:uncharacterized protein ARMOST_19945 [Armillaria ostoyae]|uniref:Uncharacterized protein n=1 Tax=Armillaria ostoyae TaxID=47428 RepID=A0A284S601_ARMOS|nr:uncharacterized protein ARMOST_19945 [Armillaria ostoyae]